MPRGDIISEDIKLHSVSSELGVVYTGTARATISVTNGEEKELKRWPKQNSCSETTK